MNRVAHVLVAWSSIFSLSFAAAAEPAAESAGWQAGAAKVKITPTTRMWMSGYAARTRPAEGTLIDLWAKALVLNDPTGRRVVLVTMDLVGIPRELSLAVRTAIAEKHGLDASQVMLAVSHTHCGPVVGGNLGSMYFLDEAQNLLVDKYAEELKTKLSAVAAAAFERLAPATLTWGSGQAMFAVNRRENKEAEVPQLRDEGRLAGPVDYDVPVLAVRDDRQRLVAAVFGYACHATVLDFYQWSGDYPGFAQAALEAAHPGMTALFWAGCGADQNPIPRRDPPLCQQYGERLAEAVERVLAGVMRPIAGELRSSYREIDLPFATLPTREDLDRQVSSGNKYEAERARRLIAQIAAGQPLSATYPYPVQVWRLGTEVVLVALGGEVVVDYAVRLKAELGGERVWAAGYANDVMAYIPSRRVLAEGGYEGGGAMVYYGQPSVWAPEVEELIVREVRRQVQ
jgi:neutral ceramidase